MQFFSRFLQNFYESVHAARGQGRPASRNKHIATSQTSANHSLGLVSLELLLHGTPRYVSRRLVRLSDSNSEMRYAVWSSQLVARDRATSASTDAHRSLRYTALTNVCAQGTCHWTDSPSQTPASRWYVSLGGHVGGESLLLSFRNARRPLHRESGIKRPRVVSVQLSYFGPGPLPNGGATYLERRKTFWKFLDHSMVSYTHGNQNGQSLYI